jgi:hypothetical protein
MKTATLDLYTDFLTSHLRSQINTLSYITEDVENGGDVDRTYLEMTLKQVERELKELRKFLVGRF